MVGETHRLKITLKEYWQNYRDAVYITESIFQPCWKAQQKGHWLEIHPEVYRGPQLVQQSFRKIFSKNYWTFGRKNRRKVGQGEGNTT